MHPSILLMAFSLYAFSISETTLLSDANASRPVKRNP